MENRGINRFALSPDGTALAFDKQAGHAALGIFVLNLNTDNCRQVTGETFPSDYYHHLGRWASNRKLYFLDTQWDLYQMVFNRLP